MRIKILMVGAVIFISGAFFGVKIGEKLINFPPGVWTLGPTSQQAKIDQNIGLMIGTYKFDEFKRRWREENFKLKPKESTEVLIDIESVTCDMTFEQFEEVVREGCKKSL